MDTVKILAIGDNVCDKYMSRGKMYPGGQSLNTSVYAAMQGAETAYLGKYGTDEVAAYNRKVLAELGVDDGHSRQFPEENGFAMVTLKNNDRVFLGSNKGGVAKEYGYDFQESDIEYIKGFQLVYTNLNSYIEDDLPLLKEIGVPIAYDFSTRWTDEYLQKVGPYVDIAIMSCAHLSDAERVQEMKKAQAQGIRLVLGTVGEAGSYVLYKDAIHYAPAVKATSIKDTMGAGDSYFATFLTEMLRSSKTGAVIEGTDEEMAQRLQTAMSKGAVFSAQMCGKEGAFGYGTPIQGRTEL